MPDYRMLGPVEVWADGRSIQVGGPRERRILAVLVLRANQVVGIDRLVRAGWDTDPPATARRQVQNRVAALRAVLTRIGGVIETENAGYLLRVGADGSDLMRFERLVRRGRAAGDPALLREALALWRGPALADLGGVLLAREAVVLDEQRLNVVEECVDLELAAGGHDGLVGELTTLVAANPLRERLVGQLMATLVHSGRTADATAAYEAHAARLADEVGLDPSPALRAAYDALVHGRPPPAAAVPSQLPADVSGFTGRLRELSTLDRLWSDGQADRALVISAIAGTAGVGKSALAVHWAHRVRDKFADGQLYVNLRGYAPAVPVRPVDALGWFLRALGVPAERVPADVDEAGALYRSLLADRRVLVLLDNAAGADQVRPLLPGGAGSLAVVTSRDALAGLVARDGAHRVPLDVLSGDEAVALLAELLGGARVAAEPGAAAEIARLCASLPLALRIAAADVADGERLADYAARLAAGDRLAALEVGGDEQAAVRRAFDLSYGRLDEPARRLFRLLGLVPGQDVTAEAAAALADCTADEATDLLRRLVGAHLVNRAGPGRYAFHDLLRLYAAEHAAADPGHATALGRLYDWYLHGARAAAELIAPGRLHLPLPDRSGAHWPVPSFADDTQALAWLDAECANLVVAATTASARGPRSGAWLIADAIRVYLFMRANPALGEVSRAALDAADADGDPHARAVSHLGVGYLDHSLSRYAEAGTHFTAALDLARRVDWPRAEIAALHNLGDIARLAGRPAESAGYHADALALARRMDWTVAQASEQAMLGTAYRDLGRLAEAVDCDTEALDLYRAAGARLGEAGALDTLGEVYLLLGRLDDARATLGSALALMREVGVPEGEAEVVRLLAAVERAGGDPHRAAQLADEALALAGDIGSARAQAHVLSLMAALDDDRGAHGSAVEHGTRALDVARESGDRLPELDAMIALATAYAHLGHLDDARRHAEAALALATGSGYRLLEGDARTALAEIALAAGDRAGAADEARRALAIHRATGYAPGAARAAAVLSRASA